MSFQRTLILPSIYAYINAYIFTYIHVECYMLILFSSDLCLGILQMLLMVNALTFFFNSNSDKREKKEQKQEQS